MTKIAAKGVVFGIEDTALPGTYVTVAQVRNMSGPTMAADAIDVSHHGLSRMYRRKVQGFKDGGEVTLDLLFDPVEVTHDLTTDGLLELFDTGVTHNFRITWPDVGATEWDFSGILTGYEPDAPFDDALTASVTIMVDDAPTFPAGTP